MLIALFKVRTINLTELACGFSSQENIDSRYKRIKQFFKEFTISFPLVASWVVQFSGFTDQAMYLSMDRTNWLWGKSNINILILSIPLFWNLLPKRGNSDTAERIEIISRFIEQFGKSKIAAVLADREYVGNDWFDWLLKKVSFFVSELKIMCSQRMHMDWKSALIRYFMT